MELSVKAKWGKAGLGELETQRMPGRGFAKTHCCDGMRLLVGGTPNPSNIPALHPIIPITYHQLTVYTHGTQCKEEGYLYCKVREPRLTSL